MKADGATNLYCRERLEQYGAKKRLPEFAAWRGMVSRCERMNDKDYDRYGGRGIRVCDRWLGTAGFWHFLDDMGRRPDGMTIERKDVDGNYEPGNCRWATWVEQNNNTRRSRVVPVLGMKRTAAEWARLVGLPRQTIITRLEHGWDPRAAVCGLAGESKAEAHARLGATPRKAA